MALLALLDLKANPARRAPPVHLDQKVPLALLDLKVKLAKLELLDLLARLVLLAPQELKLLIPPRVTQRLPPITEQPQKTLGSIGRHPVRIASSSDQTLCIY